MVMNQPKWRCIAQLGDANPIDHGGYWIFTDETGAYPPEAEYLAVDDDGDRTHYTAYLFSLDRCTFTGGILSDNEFNPDHPAWFADRDAHQSGLSSVATFTGQSVEELTAALCSEDPRERAHAYRAIGDYHGWDNLDSYPLQLTRAQARKRYGKAQYRVK